MVLGQLSAARNANRLFDSQNNAASGGSDFQVHLKCQAIRLEMTASRPARMATTTTTSQWKASAFSGEKDGGQVRPRGP